MDLDELLKTGSARSEYELRHVRFSNITYDKEACYLFLSELKAVRDRAPESRLCKILEAIYNDLDHDRLKLWLEGDEHEDRMANIEKWARLGASEIAIKGQYSLDTFLTISQFPLADYSLIVKRVQELVYQIQDVTSQAERIGSGMPGQ